MLINRDIFTVLDGGFSFLFIVYGGYYTSLMEMVHPRISEGLMQLDYSGYFPLKNNR